MEMFESPLEELLIKFETRLGMFPGIQGNQLFVNNYHEYKGVMSAEIEDDLSCDTELEVKRINTYTNIPKLDYYGLLMAFIKDSSLPRLKEKEIEPSMAGTIHNIFELGDSALLTYYHDGKLIVETKGVYNSIYYGLSELYSDNFESESLVITEVE